MFHIYTCSYPYEIAPSDLPSTFPCFFLSFNLNSLLFQVLHMSPFSPTDLCPQLPPLCFFVNRRSTTTHSLSSPLPLEDLLPESYRSDPFWVCFSLVCAKLSLWDSNSQLTAIRRHLAMSGDMFGCHNCKRSATGI